MCHHERRLKMKISQLILTHGSHPTSDTPFENQSMKDPPRPSVIILAHLTEESLRLISNIQDEIIAKNPDIKHLRVKQEKIHVTMVATYSEDGLQQLFDKTINKVKKNRDLLFELSEIDDFNGNLVAKLRD